MQLLQLAVALTPGEKDHTSLEEKMSSPLKSFDYVDAITNLMVRNESEVVAATSFVCGGQQARGIISTNSANNICQNAQVRPQYTSYVWYS